MRPGHFDTKDTKIMKGAKKSYGAFAVEIAGTGLAGPENDLRELRALRVEMPWTRLRICPYGHEGTNPRLAATSMR